MKKEVISRVAAWLALGIPAAMLASTCIVRSGGGMFAAAMAVTAIEFVVLSAGGFCVAAGRADRHLQ